jgi:hypothetical protein
MLFETPSRPAVVVLRIAPTGDTGHANAAVTMHLGKMALKETMTFSRHGTSGTPLLLNSAGDELQPHASISWAISAHALVRPCRTS